MPAKQRRIGGLHVKRIMALLLAGLLALGGLGAVAEPVIAGAIVIDDPELDCPLEPESAEPVLDLDLGLDIAQIALDVPEPVTDEVKANDEAAPAGVKIDEAAFPDKAFRDYVLATIDLDRDGVLSAAEAGEVTRLAFGNEDDDEYDSGAYPLDCQNLAGLEFFPDLAELYIVKCPVQKVDVRKNARLEKVTLCETNVEALDLRKNAALASVNVANNANLATLRLGSHESLTSVVANANRLGWIDVRGCPALKQLDVEGNQLAKLNVSKCPRLVNLFCSGNRLAALNVSKCTRLTSLEAQDNALAKLDLSKCARLVTAKLKGNRLATLNVSGCAKLEELDAQDNALAKLSLAGCKRLVRLNCSNNNITSLNVLQCSKLNYLFAGGNRLTSVNVSKCPKLVSLVLSAQQKKRLKRIDVTRNAALEKLDFSDNQVSKVNLGKNTALTDLSAHGNPIRVLDIGKCPGLVSLVKGSQKAVSDDKVAWTSVEASVSIPKSATLYNGKKVLYKGK